MFSTVPVSHEVYEPICRNLNGWMPMQSLAEDLAGQTKQFEETVQLLRTLVTVTNSTDIWGKRFSVMIAPRKVTLGNINVNVQE